MFSWLSPKRNILQNGLLRGMTDVHSHLLPGVDDGVASEAAALSALTFLKKEVGVKRVYLTPHIMGDLPSNCPPQLKTRFDTFQQKVPEGIEVRLAGEYMLDAAFREQMKEGLLAMSGGHVLVETSYLSPPSELTDMLYEISLEGYTPIVAHPERYVYMTDTYRYRLKEKGCKFQMNLMSLCGTYGKGSMACATALLNRGFYDYVGSDFHDLDIYRHSLKHLYLTQKQKKRIETLLENNRTLW